MYKCWINCEEITFRTISIQIFLNPKMQIFTIFPKPNDHLSIHSFHHPKSIFLIVLELPVIHISIGCPFEAHPLFYSFIEIFIFPWSKIYFTFLPGLRFLSWIILSMFLANMPNNADIWIYNNSTIWIFSNR